LTYSQLVTAIGASGLTAGQKITITDFATIHYILDGDGGIIFDDLTPVTNTGVTEPLTVTALSSNEVSNFATSSLYPQDIIHYDWNPNNWVNDPAFGYSSVILSGFKGVIYFRHDTMNDVSMGHDFRNVLNRRWKRNDPEYSAETEYEVGNNVQDLTGVFQSIQAENIGNALNDTSWWIKIIDFSITSHVCAKLSLANDPTDYIDVLCFYSQEANPDLQYKKEVKSVHLKPFQDNIVTQYFNGTILQNNVFALEPDYGFFQVIGLSTEMFCFNNTFLGYNEFNIIGASFNNNIIGSDCNINFIYSNCQGNIIGSAFYSNFIGINFQDSIIGSNFKNNKISDFNFANSINFLTATHVYQDYSCNILLAQGDSYKLLYIDNTGVQQIVNATD